MRVDLKSMVLGMIFLAVFFIVIGQKSKPTDSNGRYQLIVPTTSDRPFQSYLVDTHTGDTRVMNDRPWPHWSNILISEYEILQDTLLKRLYFEQLDFLREKNRQK